jgi:CheY-like chemotaxis protein
VQDATGPVAVLRGSETVLVVEDQREVRRLAREILEGYGYEVLEAASGAEALKVFQSHGGQVCLLLTDVVMPAMTGRELAEQMRTLRPDIKVLFMSGYTDNVIIHHGALDPQVAYIQKPFSPVSLALKVLETLGMGALKA